MGGLLIYGWGFDPSPNYIIFLCQSLTVALTMLKIIVGKKSLTITTAFATDKKLHRMTAMTANT